MTPLNTVARAAHEVWPDVTWATAIEDGSVFWILGRAQDGRETQRYIEIRPVSDDVVMDEMRRACQEIAHELSPAFIDWEQVAS